jgi:penicillin-binding protein 2
MKQLVGGLLVALVLGGCGSPPPPASRVAPVDASLRAESAFVRSLRGKLAGRELTLVSALQSAAEDALLATGKPGAVVAFEPNRGSVEALFSVAGDRGDPLVTPQMPASTFKSFMTFAGVRAGVLNDASKLTCDGAYDFAGAHLTCPMQHGAESPSRALAVSCNAFYYQLAAKLDAHVVAGVAHQFELDARSGIELDDAPGVIPPAPNTKGPPETPRPLVDAVGHGDYRVTLLGLARAYGAIATGGTLVELHVVRAQRASAKRLVLEPMALRIVQQGLRDAVESDEGRAHAIAISGFRFAGKTGSADPPPRAGTAADPEEIDSWFVAYAPPERPTVVVAARVERGAPFEAGRVVRQVLVSASTAKPH